MRSATNPEEDDFGGVFQDLCQRVGLRLLGRVGWSGEWGERKKNKQQIREMEQARSISEAECYPFILSPQLWFTWRIPTAFVQMADSLKRLLVSFSGNWFLFCVAHAAGHTHTHTVEGSLVRQKAAGSGVTVTKQQRNDVCHSVFQREICGFKTEKQEAWKSLF